MTNTSRNEFPFKYHLSSKFLSRKSITQWHIKHSNPHSPSNFSALAISMIHYAKCNRANSTYEKVHRYNFTYANETDKHHRSNTSERIFPRRVGDRASLLSLQREFLTGVWGVPSPCLHVLNITATLFHSPPFLSLSPFTPSLFAVAVHYSPLSLSGLSFPRFTRQARQREFQQLVPLSQSLYKRSVHTRASIFCVSSDGVAGPLRQRGWLPVEECQDGVHVATL